MYGISASDENDHVDYDKARMNFTISANEASF